MTKSERCKQYFYNLTQDTQFCINCQHFYRHYQRNGRPFECGHCVYPRLKMRETYATCSHFENKYH